MYLFASLETLLMGGALNDIWIFTLRGLFFLSAILLITLVLLQEGKGGGLAAALGGQGAETFGVATGGVNKVTMALAGVLLLSGLLHAVFYEGSVVAGMGGGKSLTTQEEGDGDTGGGTEDSSGGGEDTEK